MALAIGTALLVSALPKSLTTLWRGGTVRLPLDASDAMLNFVVGGVALSLAQIGTLILFYVACHRAFLIDEREAALRRAITRKRRHTCFLWLPSALPSLSA